MFEFNAFDWWTLQALAVDLVVIVFLLVSLRFVKGLVANVSALEVLKDHNNQSFGIAYGGGIVALSIVLSGVSAGAFEHTLLNEAMTMMLFGVFGLLLVKVGLVIQDKLVFTQVAIQQQIGQGNIAAAWMDVGNSIAVALLIRSAMMWVEGSIRMTLGFVAGVFILSQVLLSLAAAYRKMLFKKRNQGKSFQAAISTGNSALALRYAAYISGVAMAMTGATGFVTFKAEELVNTLMQWGIFAIVLVVLYSIIVYICKRVILAGIDTAEYVDKKGDMEVAAVEASICVAFGITFIALFS